MAGEGFDLGTAYGRIVISTDGIDSAIGSAQKSINSGLSSISDSFSNIGQGFSKIGGALTAITAPLTAIGGVGLKAASDFDTLMKQIEIFGGVSGDQLEQVRKFALKMGADTKFSTEEAAQAYLELLKSGQSLEQATSTLPTVLDLAAAGELGLAQAAGIVSSGLAIYKLKAEDAGRVSDALAKAANASRAEVRDLGDALTTAGPVAAQYGLSVEDTAAALAVMANNGIMGAEAGTQLKSMLLNLHRPTDDVKGALQQLGVNLYDSAGNARNFNDVIVDLDTALDKLPVEQQNELMQKLGGSYGITGLAALRAAGGINSMMTEMDKAPAAKTLAEAFMNTFQGGVESLRGSVETLLIQALTPFMNDVLVPLVKQVTQVVNAMTDWAQKNPDLANTIVKILVALIALGPVLFLIGQGIGIITTMGEGLELVMGGLLGPIGLIIVAAIGLYLAFKNNFLGIRDLLEPILKNVVTGFQTLVGVIQNFGNIVQNQGIGEAIASIVNAFMQMLGLVANDEMAQGALDIGNGIVNAFLSVVQALQTYVLPVLQTLADWFLNDALPAVIDFITSAVIPAIQSFINFLGGLWEIVGPHLQDLANWFIHDALPAILDFITGSVIPTIGDFIQTLTNIWNFVAPHLLQLADWFMNTGLPAIGQAVQWFIDNIWNPATTALSQLWVIIQPVLQDLLNWFITEGLPFINQALTDFQTNILGPAITLLSGIWDAVSTGLTNLFNWFNTTGMPIINAVIQAAMDNFITPLINLVKGIWDSVSKPLGQFNDFFQNTFSVIGSAFIQPVIDFINKIPQAVQDSIQEIIRLTDAVINNPLIQQINPMMAQVATVWNQSKDALLKSGADSFSAGQGGGAQFRDNGGMGIAGMPYLIGAPQMNQEVYVPNTNGQFLPNFMEMMQGLAGGRSVGDVIVQVPLDVLRDEPNLERNGEKLGNSIVQKLQNRGSL